MVAKEDLKLIQMTEVPKSYFMTLKANQGLKLFFYSNLLQITVNSNGMIFDLDTMQEVNSIEHID